MRNGKSSLYAILLVCILFASVFMLAGCKKTVPSSGIVSDTTGNKVTTPADDSANTGNNADTGANTGILGPKYKGTLLAGSKTPYLLYTDEDYEKAVAEGKIIMLYFYAEGCSACKADQSIIYEAFNEMEITDIIGFRVNYDDEYTTLSEKKLAEDFDVDVSQTRVIVKDGKSLQKSKIPWNSNDYIRQLTQYLE